MWFGANCMVVTISTGSLAVVTGFSLFWSGVALIIGLLVGGVFMVHHSAQGPQLGLPQMIQSRAQVMSAASRSLPSYWPEVLSPGR